MTHAATWLGQPLSAGKRYCYLGDRLTARELRGALCIGLLKADGKCVTGRSAMLVLFDGEQTPRSIQRRFLRKTL